MKADFTRLTFDPTKHYRAVQQQQGRVQLDSDWNEQLDITAHRVETETVDVVGTCGAPLHDDGFRLVEAAADLTADEAARPENKTPPTVKAGDLLITAGRFYAGGVLAENDRIALVSAQPDLPSGDDTTSVGGTALFPLAAPGTYLAYLDVWPRLRTAIDDPRIREVALGGPDTTTRTKNTWQVKFLPAPDGANCSTAIPAWDALLNPGAGTLAASVAKSASKPGPCIVDPGSGYRRLENQLYRVEVHIGGDSLGKTSFKWSRDNGSIVTKWLDQSVVGQITVESTGRDKVLNLAASNLIELTDDAHEELGLPGVFATIESVSGTTLKLHAPTAEMDRANFPKNPKVRRWESVQTAPGKWITPDGQTVGLDTTHTFELEDGIVVRFGAGSFRTGDYWVIPARTALPQVDWPTTGPSSAPVPVPQPPHGVKHQYCKLAIVEFKAGAFKISDCRSLFPPVTELTSLFYVGGDAQQVTPDPTLPATTPYLLPMPLYVGVANGEWPVTGARVRFRTNPGGGELNPADGIVVTANGTAFCRWSINATIPNPEVVAELLDSADNTIGLPVVFHATLNTAKLVAYDPANCEGMKNAAPPVVTVQDALDFLCHEKSGVDCCVTVGQLGDRPGDYATVAEAIEDLLRKRRFTGVCLSLLPGDHPIEKELLVTAEEKTAVFFKIAGCSHASRLVVKAPLIFRRLAGVVIRDISVLVDGGGIDFAACGEVEISSCNINGRAATNLALLQFATILKLTFAANQMVASGKPKPAAPEKIFESVASLEKAFSRADEHDFKTAAESAAKTLVELKPAERIRMAKTLDTALKRPDVELSAPERKSYVAMIKTLGTDRINAKTLAARLADIREKLAPSATTPGLAIALFDCLATNFFNDNRIAGSISLGGWPAKEPINDAEFKLLLDLVRNGAIEIIAAIGTLELRGNQLSQLVAGEQLVSTLRQAIHGKKGKIAVWSCAHFTDNIVALGGNTFTARHVSLTTTRFNETKAALGLALANTATYLGNIADADVVLNNVTRKPKAEAANQGLSIQP